MVKKNINRSFLFRKGKINLKKYTLWKEPRDQGYVMPLVLLVMLIVFSLGGALIAEQNFLLRESNEYKHYQETILLSKNELEVFHATVAKEPKKYWSPPFNMYNVKRTNEDGSVYEQKYYDRKGNQSVYWIWLTQYGLRRRYKVTLTFSDDKNTLTDFSAHIWSRKDDLEYEQE